MSACRGGLSLTLGSKSRMKSLAASNRPSNPVGKGAPHPHTGLLLVLNSRRSSSVSDTMWANQGSNMFGNTLIGARFDAVHFDVVSTVGASRSQSDSNSCTGRGVTCAPMASRCRTTWNRYSIIINYSDLNV